MLTRRFHHCLVTGGAGFIGSNLVDHLLAQLPQTRISVFDSLSYAGRRENLAHLEGNPRFHFIEGNLGDRAACEAALDGIDCCFHLAAETHVDRSIESSLPFLTTNVVGTGNLLEAARAKALPLLVSISTDEVYGSISEGSHVETDILNPSNPYSASKAGADLLALSYRTTHGTPLIVTRCTNNYGPRQFLEKLIPLFIERALRDQPLPIYGNGSNIRDWLHVRDHCSALLKVAQSGDIGEIYNIGGGQEISNLEITRTLLQLLSKPDSLIHYVEDRPGHDLRYSLSWKKLAQLDWKPSFDFASGIRETIAWYQANTGWLAAIREGSQEYLRFNQHHYAMKPSTPSLSG
jgi:dTDP-glucose 4,6-dehydratase